MDEEKALEFTQASAAVMELVFRSKGRFRNSEIECLTVVHDHTLGELRYFAPISRTDFLRRPGYPSRLSQRLWAACWLRAW